MTAEEQDAVAMLRRIAHQMGGDWQFTAVPRDWVYMRELFVNELRAVKAEARKQGIEEAAQEADCGCKECSGEEDIVDWCHKWIADNIRALAQEGKP